MDTYFIFLSIVAAAVSIPITLAVWSRASSQKRHDEQTWMMGLIEKTLDAERDRKREDTATMNGVLADIQQGQRESLVAIGEVVDRVAMGMLGKTGGLGRDDVVAAVEAAWKGVQENDGGMAAEERFEDFRIPGENGMRGNVAAIGWGEAIPGIHDPGDEHNMAGEEYDV